MAKAIPNSTTVLTEQETLATSKSWNVAIVGFGTVGSSVARILSERSLASLRLTHICNRNIERKRVDWLPATVRWTEDIAEVLSS